MEELFSSNFFDIDSCFVCGEYMGTFKNELTVPTGYSENTVLQIIEKILKFSISKDYDVVKNGGICQNCFIKFNEYDEFQTKAEAIKSDLFLMITSRKNYVECKEEVDDNQIIYTEFDENMVEYEELQEHFQLITEEISSKKEQKDESKSYQDDNDTKDDRFAIKIVNNLEFTCEICFKMFSSKSSFKTHQLVHSEERKIKCDQCGSNFKTINGLKNHLKLHLNKFYHCDLCSKKFKGKHELRCHIEAIHLLRKDHICKLCGKAFSRYKTLCQHLLYHSNDRGFKCQICGFKTINAPKLKRHLKSHSGKRDYSCSICNKRFLYSYNVTAHIRHVHFKEKRPLTENTKLTCHVCGKKYQKIWKVKEHMREAHNILEEIALIHV